MSFFAAGIAGLVVLLGLNFEAPSGFVAETPQTKMQVARFRLPAEAPGADGKPAAASEQDGLLVVYYFGKGMGGSTEDNVKRWVGQFSERDGEPRVEEAKTASGLKMTLVEVSGTEFAPTPMNPAPPKHPGWRMLGAIIETPEGSYFAKATGPKATIEKHAKAIRAYFESAKP